MTTPAISHYTCLRCQTGSLEARDCPRCHSSMEAIYTESGSTKQINRPEDELPQHFGLAITHPHFAPLVEAMSDTCVEIRRLRERSLEADRLLQSLIQWMSWPEGGISKAQLEQAQEKAFQYCKRNGLNV